MSNRMDRYLLKSNVPHVQVVNLQRSTAQTVEARIDEATQRMQLRVAVLDSYDIISVLSIYWKSGDTGSAEDSSLFIETVSKLHNVQTCQRSLSDDDGILDLAPEVLHQVAPPQSGSRKLFILHYAGHAIVGSTPDSLIITPRIGQKLRCGPGINMSYFKDELKAKGSMSSGLDVLLVIDCCCANIARQGGKAKGSRVELMATKGISNSRQDGRTLTQHWCAAFTKLLETGNPFTCDDIIKDITPDSELEQYPFAFVLREGWDLPSTFRLHPGPIESTLPAAVTPRTVVTVFHVEENPNSPPLKQLTDYLNKAPVPITVLAALPTSSTLLLLRIPMFLEELLVLPRVALLLTDS
jgi:hypothetical protein